MSAFEQTFRQKGISLTSSRLAIFEVLENASAHMTVTDIFNAARQKMRITRSTAMEESPVQR